MTENERRASVNLSDEQIESIAERAAEKAIERVYMEIGKSVVRKTLWLIGVVAVGGWLYLSSTGKAPR